MGVLLPLPLQLQATATSQDEIPLAPRRSQRTLRARQDWLQPPYSPPDFRYSQKSNEPVTAGNMTQAFILQAMSAAAQALEPGSYAEAMNTPKRDKWLLAAKDEFNSLIENETWSLVDLPPGRRAIEGKWVFKRKYHADGSLERFKARFVVRGFRQQPGVDYIEHELFSPVVRVSTIRFLMALVAELDWELEQLDVVTAFLNGDLQETVYVTQPLYVDG